MEVLGIDIGGSGIKGAIVDTKRGVFITDRKRLPTPTSLEPKAVLATISKVVRHFDTFDGPIGMGFPAVVVNGAPRTAFTAHHIPGWVGYPVARHLSEELGRPVTMLNDADAAGIAEMRFGNGRGEDAVVLILTLGTGIGSALFNDGILVPNTEFGKIYLQGAEEVVEQYASSLAREREDLSWKTYAGRLQAYLRYMDWLLSPQLIIIGGGISKKHHKFLPHIDVDTKVIPAALRNRAGIIGAATAAAEGWHH